MSKIEILMATYNGDKYLKDQLFSLFEQSYQDFRITIRDDCSTDTTLDIINFYITKYGKNKISVLPNNGIRLGSTQSFFTLLKASSENYIMFCDQDDFWLSDKIAKTFEKMKALEPTMENLPLLVFSDLKEVDKKLNVLSESFMKNQKLFPHLVVDDPIKLLALNVVAGCTMMINRIAIDYMLPIPLTIKNIVHDQWIAVNVAKYGKIEFLNQSLILYRQHGNNAVGANDVGLKYFLKKFSTPARQFFIYKNMIVSLNFKVSLIKFFAYKMFFTIKRL